MVTIKDLAAYTGVSATTISNVIHGRSGRVSAETVARVNQAIRELGYTPNMSARSLVSKSSRVVAFINHVIIRSDANVTADPFHSSTIGVLEKALRSQGYYLMIRTISTPDELTSFLANWNIDGMFFTGVFHDSFYEAISHAQVPTVLIDSYVHQPAVWNVGLEDFHGSFLATCHLIEKGHRCIGFASPSVKDGGVLQERFLGYKAALTEHGIPFDQNLIFEHEMDSLTAYHEAAADIVKHPDMTAVVITADLMAIGIIAALRDLGKRVPEDISVVGFDDIQPAQLNYPKLTTIHQDMTLKARTAADTMLTLLKGEEEPQNRNVILPVSLVERDSVKDLRENS